MVQSVLGYSVTKIVTMIKSLTAREMFKQCPEAKKQLWGREFWGKGYFVNTVGQHGHRGNGTEKMIAKYVQEQGLEKEYNSSSAPL